MFGHLAFFETCFLHLVFSTLHDTQKNKYLHGAQVILFQARMDPLDDQDLNLARTFSNFERLSAYLPLNFVSRLGDSTELNSFSLTVRLRFYDFYHQPWRVRGGATNRKYGSSIPDGVIGIFNRLNTSVAL